MKVTPDTCEAGKETTTALMEILSFGGSVASSVKLCRRGMQVCFRLAMFKTGKAQLAEPKLTLMIL